MASRSAIVSRVVDSRGASSEPPAGDAPQSSSEDLARSETGDQGVGDAGSSAPEADGRYPLRLYGDTNTMLPSGKVSETIWNNFEKFPNPTGYSWKLVPVALKNSYFEEFKKTFSWSPENEARVRKSWDARAARRYRDFIHAAKAGRNDPEKGRPEWIPPAAWDGWLAYWNSPEVIAKSEKARRNRLSEPEGPGTGISKHKGGSKCALQYAIEIAKEKGLTEEQVAADVFERLHMTKDGDYTDAKARRIAMRMEERIQTLSQPDPDTAEVPTVDRSKVYIEAAGGLDSRRRLFSASYMAHTLDGSSSSSVGNGPQSFASMTAMQEQIAKLAADNERQNQMMAQMAADRDRQNEMMTQMAVDRDRQNEMMTQMAAMLKATQDRLDALPPHFRSDQTPPGNI